MLSKRASKIEVVKDLLKNLHNRGRMTMAWGNADNASNIVHRLAPKAGEQLAGGALKGYTNSLNKYKTYAQEFNQRQSQWGNYVNNMPAPQRMLTRAAGGVTGFAYDVPKTLLGMPSASMNPLIGPTVLYGGIPMAAHALTGHQLEVDPYVRAGSLGYNMLGNPQQDVEYGFKQGAGEVANNALDYFQGSNLRNRHDLLNGGMNRQLNSFGYHDPHFSAAARSGDPNVLQNKGRLATFINGDFDDSFYRGQAYQKALPYISNGMNKTASTSSTLINDVLGATRKYVGRKGAAAAENLKSGFKFNPQQSFDTDGVKPSILGNWYHNLPRSTRMIAGYGGLAGIGGMAFNAGSSSYGGYQGARSSALNGGYQAGQDVASIGIQNQLNNMPQWQKLLATMAPGMATDYARKKINPLLQGTAGFGKIPQVPHPSPNLPIHKGVGSMYTNPDGTEVYSEDSP